MSKTIKRITKNQYYMKFAEIASERGTCPKRQVGAILVKNDRIISTAYNGAPKDQPHCDIAGCEESLDGHCKRAVHSETNAILSCAKNGQSTDGAILYCTDFPCVYCLKNIINAGIRVIFYKRPYKNHENFIDLSNLTITQL